MRRLLVTACGCVVVLGCAGSRTPTVATTVAAPGGADSASSTEYGVNSVMTYDLDDPTAWGLALAQMATLHVRVARNDFLWDEMEPSPGVYNWGGVDSIVAQLRAAGIDPLMTVYGSPTWANAAPDSTTNPRGFIPQDSATFVAWVNQYAAFMSIAAARYRGQVKKWELWNEENSPQYWATPSVANYALWFSTVYAAIKTADPTCMVGIGGMTTLGIGTAVPPYISGVQFLGGLYAAGITPDAVAIHPYSLLGPTVTEAGQESFSDIAAIQQVMAAAGQGAEPLWVTEWGWSITTNLPSVVAQYITQSLDLIATQYPYVSVATYFQLQDTGGFAYGLYDASGTIRPGGTAFAEFAVAHGQ